MKSRLRLLDTEAIAWHYKVSTGTVRRWASEGRFTPYGSRRERLWNLTEVDAWLRRRKQDADRRARQDGVADQQRT